MRQWLGGLPIRLESDCYPQDGRDGERSRWPLTAEGRPPNANFRTCTSIAVLGFASLVVVLASLTGAGGTATGRGLAILGLLAFMVGAVWLGWTVLRNEPLATWPYGLGLVAISAAGLLVMVAGSAYPAGSPAADAPESSTAADAGPQQGSQQPASDQDTCSELHDQIADIRLQLAENERRISELESLLGQGNPPEAKPLSGDSDVSIDLVGPLIARADQVRWLRWSSFCSA